MTELNSRDQELACTLCQTLEAAASRPDPLLDAALAATRAQIAAKAQNSKAHRSPWWLMGGFALAASVAVVIMLPYVSPKSASTAGVQVQSLATKNAPMPDADLQMLQDMDMLGAFNENSNEG
jgi:hypothetical protein